MNSFVHAQMKCNAWKVWEAKAESSSRVSRDALIRLGGWLVEESSDGSSRNVCSDHYHAEHMSASLSL